MVVAPVSRGEADGREAYWRAPASAIPGVIDEAASTGVRAVTVITAGFGETGRSGAAVDPEMLSVARRHGMRIVGLNCLDVANTDPGVRMNATFALPDPLSRRLALVSQSGAVGIVLGELRPRREGPWTAAKAGEPAIQLTEHPPRSYIAGSRYPTAGALLLVAPACSTSRSRTCWQWPTALDTT